MEKVRLESGKMIAASEFGKSANIMSMSESSSSTDGKQYTEAEENIKKTLKVGHRWLSVYTIFKGQLAPKFSSHPILFTTSRSHVYEDLTEYFIIID